MKINLRMEERGDVVMCQLLLVKLLDLRAKDKIFKLEVEKAKKLESGNNIVEITPIAESIVLYLLQQIRCGKLYRGMRDFGECLSAPPSSIDGLINTTQEFLAIFDEKELNKKSS